MLSVLLGTGNLTQTTKKYLYLIENSWILFLPSMLVKNNSLCLKQYLIQLDTFDLQRTQRRISCYISVQPFKTQFLIVITTKNNYYDIKSRINTYNIHLTRSYQRDKIEFEREIDVYSDDMED